MKLIQIFQDLQNEPCEVHQDHLGNFYIGRRGSKMMNLSLDRLEEVFFTCKTQKNKIGDENTI